MRLKITLEPEYKNYLVPFNYQYQMSGAVYSVIRDGSEEYAKWLHEVGEEVNKRGKIFMLLIKSTNFNSNKYDKKNFTSKHKNNYFFIKNY